MRARIESALCICLGLSAGGLGCDSFVVKNTKVVMPSATVPISLTGALLDRDGIVDPSRIHRVGRFQFAQKECEDDKKDVQLDVSQAINTQVAGAGGNAITHLQISASERDECALVRLEGDIVKVAAR